MNQSERIPIAVFVLAVSSTDLTFNLHQIVGNFWECTEDAYTSFVNLEKAQDRIPREKLECYGSTLLTAACYWPSSNCLPAKKFVSVTGDLNHTVERGCLTPTSVFLVTTLHFFGSAFIL